MKKLIAIVSLLILTTSGCVLVKNERTDPTTGVKNTHSFLIMNETKMKDVTILTPDKYLMMMSDIDNKTAIDQKAIVNGVVKGLGGL